MMVCWHCDKELDLSYHTDDFMTKVYHCEDCDRWYEMKKEKPKLNAAVPVMFTEMQEPPLEVKKAA